MNTQQNASAPALARITAHVAAVSDEARADMAAGKWDEVITDALYSACGAETADEMAEARAFAEAIAKGQPALAHTAGPWEVETKGSKHFIDGADGLTVAYLDRAGVRERPTIEANARLIAAAPELLAALRALLRVARADDIGLDDREARNAALPLAEAAIAKAEGAP